MTSDQKLNESRRQIEQADELKLYFMIQEIGKFIMEMEHDISHDRVPKQDRYLIDEELSKLRPLQLHAVSQLKKVGLDRPLKEDGVSPTTEYWKWYKWWDDYIRGLPEEQWKDLDERIRTNKNYSEFRPEGDWK